MRGRRVQQIERAFWLLVVVLAVVFTVAALMTDPEVTLSSKPATALRGCPR